MKTSDMELFRDCLDKWGKELQLIMVVEELAELQKEITKYLRGKLTIRGIVEEIADVELMLDQLKFILKIDDDTIKFYRKRKIKRLKMLVV